MGEQDPQEIPQIFGQVQPQDQSVLQKLSQILKLGQKTASPIGQALAPSQQGGGIQQLSQARPGTAPPQMMTPPPINFSTQGAGAAMPPPTPPPPASNYSLPESSAMMSKLDPKGAAAYSAVTGVGQILGQWQQKREQRKQSEAANIAQNLMTAIQSGDKDEVSAILNDPKATKVLTKVYKGWLTPAPQEKPQDTEVQAFTKGITDYQNKAQGGAGQPQTGVKPSATGGVQGQAPPQQQQQPQGGMPRQMGGYMLPQSLPQDLLKAAQNNAMLQRAQGDPGSLTGPNQLSSAETRQAQIYATQLGVSPKEIAILDAGNQRELVKAYARVAVEEQKQAAISQRVAGTDKARVQAAQLGKEGRLGSASITAKAGIEKAKIAGQFKLDAAKIIKDAKGKSPDEMTRKILDTQIKSFTALKNNASTKYEDAMKNDNPQAATVFKGMMDGYDTQINSLNSQMDDLKAIGDASEFNKQIQFLMGGDATDVPDEGEGDGDTPDDQ